MKKKNYFKLFLRAIWSMRMFYRACFIAWYAAIWHFFGWQAMIFWAISCIAAELNYASRDIK